MNNNLQKPQAGEGSAETRLLCSLAGLIEQLEAAGRQAMIFTDTDIETIRERWFGKAAAYRDAASMARRLHNPLALAHREEITFMDKSETPQKATDPLPPGAVLPAATCSHSGRISIADYYELPLWERWPAMRENWMGKLLQDKGLGDCVIECAMRDLLDALHRERAANENVKALPASPGTAQQRSEGDPKNE